MNPDLNYFIEPKGVAMGGATWLRIWIRRRMEEKGWPVFDELHRLLRVMSLLLQHQ